MRKSHAFANWNKKQKASSLANQANLQANLANLLSNTEEEDLFSYAKLGMRKNDLSDNIKEHAYVNARQSQVIRLRFQSESKGLNEQLPVLLFKRRTT